MSAIVPNYNDADNLARSVRALQTQLDAADEILIVDDASTDSSRDVMAAIAASDPRVHLHYHSENTGPIGAINTGLKAASGDCVVLASANDVLAPRFMGALISQLMRHPDAAFACGEMRLVEDGKSVGIRPVARPSSHPEFFSSAQTAALLRRYDNLFMTGASIVVRERLREIGYLREELASFADGFALRALALRHGFVFVPEIVSEWRIDRNSISRRVATDVPAARAVLKAATAAFSTDSYFPSDYPEVFARRWSFAVLRLALTSPNARALIFEFAPGGRSEKTTVSWLSRLGPPGRFLALAWCALRLRPYSLFGLGQTGFLRILQRAGL